MLNPAEESVSISWFRGMAFARQNAGPNLKMASALSSSLGLSRSFCFQVESDHSLRGIWLGSRKISNEGPFVWNSTRQVLSYSSWADGQPDNHDYVEHCLTMVSTDFGGLWNDYPCSGEIENWPPQSTLCEYVGC